MEPWSLQARNFNNSHTSGSAGQFSSAHGCDAGALTQLGLLPETAFQCSARGPVFLRHLEIGFSHLVCYMAIRALLRLHIGGQSLEGRAVPARELL